MIKLKQNKMQIVDVYINEKKKRWVRERIKSVKGKDADRQGKRKSKAVCVEESRRSRSNWEIGEQEFKEKGKKAIGRKKRTIRLERKRIVNVEREKRVKIKRKTSAGSGDIKKKLIEKEK